LAFFKAVHFTGVVLTKMDGDARGGAALSIVQVTQRPILFVGVGEKIDGLEVFHPDRMAQRILGMGDVLSLIEKAEKAVRREEAAELQKKILKDEITFEDLLTQIRMIRRMGPIRQWASLIPGLPTEAMDEMDEDDLRRLEAIILSMTPQERRYPRILNASRKRRIARGSGTTLQDVNEAIRLLQDLQTMAHHIRKTAWGKVMRRFLS
jgi:signal recognition particle subunit SRP54